MPASTSPSRLTPGPQVPTKEGLDPRAKSACLAIAGREKSKAPRESGHNDGLLASATVEAYMGQGCNSHLRNLEEVLDPSRANVHAPFFGTGHFAGLSGETFAHGKQGCDGGASVTSAIAHETVEAAARAREAAAAHLQAAAPCSRFSFARSARVHRFAFQSAAGHSPVEIEEMVRVPSSDYVLRSDGGVCPNVNIEIRPAWSIYIVSVGQLQCERTGPSRDLLGGIKHCNGAVDRSNMATVIRARQTRLASTPGPRWPGRELPRRSSQPGQRQEFSGRLA